MEYNKPYNVMMRAWEWTKWYPNINSCIGMYLTQATPGANILPQCGMYMNHF